MLIVRPTSDLAKRMGIRLSAVEGRSSTRLGDWYATDLVIERRQFILAISEVGRLAVVLPAAPYASFHQRLPAALTEPPAATQNRPVVAT